MSRIACPRTTNALGTSANYIRNGRKPMLDDATALEIKRKHDAGATSTVLAKEYGVAPHTIRLAIQRAEFAIDTLKTTNAARRK